MKIFAIDCTSDSASAVIYENGRVLASAYTDSARKHSETLAPMTEHIFYEAGLSISDIDLFACNAGPGSFTGVRIGVAQIKGLAFGRNKPCVPVSTLESLAYNLIGIDGVICPVMDARRSQFYCAVFRSDGKNIVRLTSDSAMSADELTNILLAYSGEKIYFTGDGYALAHACRIPGTVDTPPILIRQNARSTAFCAEKKYKEEPGSYTDAELKPIYLRASQAERSRNERMKINE